MDFATQNGGVDHHDANDRVKMGVWTDCGETQQRGRWGPTRTSDRGQREQVAKTKLVSRAADLATRDSITTSRQNGMDENGENDETIWRLLPRGQENIDKIKFGVSCGGFGDGRQHNDIDHEASSGRPLT